MSGLDSEVRPCCHCNWRCADALLGQKQDLVITVLKQAGPVLQHWKGTDENQVDSGSGDALVTCTIPYLPIQASTSTALSSEFVVVLV
jgi:hypothetical protein